MAVSVRALFHSNRKETRPVTSHRGRWTAHTGSEVGHQAELRQGL